MSLGKEDKRLQVEKSRQANWLMTRLFCKQPWTKFTQPFVVELGSKLEALAPSRTLQRGVFDALDEAFVSSRRATETKQSFVQRKRSTFGGREARSAPRVERRAAMFFKIFMTSRYRLPLTSGDEEEYYPYALATKLRQTRSDINLAIQRWVRAPVSEAHLNTVSSQKGLPEPLSSASEASEDESNSESDSSESASPLRRLTPRSATPRNATSGKGNSTPQKRTKARVAPDLSSDSEWGGSTTEESESEYIALRRALKLNVSDKDLARSKQASEAQAARRKAARASKRKAASEPSQAASRKRARGNAVGVGPSTAKLEQLALAREAKARKALERTEAGNGHHASPRGSATPSKGHPARGLGNEARELAELKATMKRHDDLLKGLQASVARTAALTPRSKPESGLEPASAGSISALEGRIQSLEKALETLHQVIFTERQETAGHKRAMVRRITSLEEAIDSLTGVALGHGDSGM